MVGRFTYAEIMAVKELGMATDVTVLPNPARTNSKYLSLGQRRTAQSN